MGYRGDRRNREQGGIGNREIVGIRVDRLIGRIGGLGG